MARSAAAGPDALPASAGDHGLEVEHSADGAVAHAAYELHSDSGTLVLHTAFDAGTGRLRCRLSYEDDSGAVIRGSLQHTVALADGVPIAPAADPVGDYLAGDPGAVGAIDDFSDLTGEAEAGAGSEEGIRSFLQGALAGDFAGNDSWSATAGQAGIGLVPVAGQIADIRDIAAAGADLFRATRELRTLAVARRELLTRWQILLADRALSPDTRIALRKARNALQDHLTPADLSGALRDELGVPVRASGSGAVWDHRKEVAGVLRSFENLRNTLRRNLFKFPHGSSEFRRISAAMDAIHETASRIEQFMRIR